jgi:3-isopropylmalate/(R)-2-methylmalate dehydratase small subunit
VIVEGTALVIPQDHVDTDVLYPGKYLSVLDSKEMARHLFDGLDPTLRDRLTPRTILLAGENFGTGSSRENVPTAMRAAGILCVVAKSFARIFHRNCINLGLPAIACPDAVAAARDGSAIRVLPETGVVEVDGEAFASAPLPPFMLELLQTGGLVPWVAKKLKSTQGHVGLQSDVTG